MAVAALNQLSWLKDTLPFIQRVVLLLHEKLTKFRLMLSVHCDHYPASNHSLVTLFSRRNIMLCIISTHNPYRQSVHCDRHLASSYCVLTILFKYNIIIFSIFSTFVALSPADLNLLNKSESSVGFSVWYSHYKSMWYYMYHLITTWLKGMCHLVEPIRYLASSYHVSGIG